MSSFALWGTFALAALSSTAIAQDDGDYSNPNPCVSYGIDFQDGGSYFQNASSTDPFTYVSIFEGCQPDVVTNVLVDPNGDEYLCSDTNLTPDDTNQLSTCPLDKDQMYSGDWSVLLLSNNGDADPIAYERDFSLSVGTPVTVTTTPTLTISIVSTPVYNATITQTSTVTQINIITTTLPKVTLKPTTTITPARVTHTDVFTLGTVTKFHWTVQPVVFTKTKTKTCSVPAPQVNKDPWCTITPTIVSAAALSTNTASATDKRRDNFRRVSNDRAVRIAERKARLAGLEKRGLDQATTTVTDLNTSDWVTSTSISYAPTSTLSVTTEVDVTSTSYTTQTLLKGTTTLRQVTITAPTPTRTKIAFTIAKTTVTVTKKPTYTVTVTTIPAASSTICRAKGGKMI